MISAQTTAAGGHADHDDPGAETRQELAADQCADDAAEVERGEPGAGDGRRQTRSREDRRQPGESEIDGEQARKERPPERKGIDPELTAENRRQ